MRRAVTKIMYYKSELFTAFFNPLRNVIITKNKLCQKSELYYRVMRAFGGKESLSANRLRFLNSTYKI